MSKKGDAFKLDNPHHEKMEAVKLQALKDRVIEMVKWVYPLDQALEVLQIPRNRFCLWYAEDEAFRKAILDAMNGGESAENG